MLILGGICCAGSKAFVILCWTLSLCLSGMLCYHSECYGDNKNCWQNQWAVEIISENNENSREIAERLAQKHGFIYKGPVGSLENFHLFEHSHIQKRSVESSSHVHKDLVLEPEVAWVEQQQIKKRVKRDFTEYHHYKDVSNLAPYDFKDPEFPEQWYLHGGSIGGEDMNVAGAWKKGYTGKGVVITILDDGIQSDHPDLHENYDPEASYDINDNDPNPYPQDNGDNRHGTRCAGEVSSMANNNHCGVGAAYHSKIGGVRMLDGEVNDHVEATALSLHPQHIDIYSASWGPEDDGRTVDGPAKMAKEAFTNGIEKGRSGKGSIFVWASGNGGIRGDNCNCDGYTNSIYTLSISSASQENKKPWYLEECSSTLATTYSSGTEGTERDIITTDFPNKCTDRHTGTSASAPLAAGLCALALEAMPKMTWRDMQYIVLMTSNPKGLRDHGQFRKNSLGREVSHMFGYGLMDAGAMVELAEQWTTVPEKHICKTEVDSKVREISPTGSIKVYLKTDGCQGTKNEAIRYLEHVQVHCTLDFYKRGDLELYLTSPMGTKSTVLGKRPRDSFRTFDDWPFLSVHFWGENPKGKWELELKNVGSSVDHGSLKSWYIVFHGTDINPVRLKKDVPSVGLKAFQTKKPPVQQPRLLNPEMCHEECVGPCTGPNPDQCVDCKHHIDTKGICVNDCPTGEYAQAMGIQCQACQETCSACKGGKLTDCTACQPGLLSVSDLGKCVENCEDGYFREGDKCVLCDEHCRRCESATVCTACKRGRILYNGECIANCPKHTYLDGDNSCKQCIEQCATCSGPKESDCLSCEENTFLHNGKCVSECPPRFYADISSWTCRACHTTCNSCTGGTSMDCTSCRHRYHMENRECILDQTDADQYCPAGTYHQRGECKFCHETCQTCIGPNAVDCLSCNVGLLHDISGTCIDKCPSGRYSIDSQCRQCHSSCFKCKGDSDSECISCHRGSHLKRGQCVSTCGARQYPRSEDGNCAPCFSTCLTCIGPLSNDCTECTGTLVFHNYTCVSKCPLGYYYSSDQDGQLECVQCHPSCQTCNGRKPTACLSCNSGYVLRRGQCLETCAESQFFNRFTQRCQGCYEFCKTCDGGKNDQCTSCKDTYGRKVHKTLHTFPCIPCCLTEQKPELHDCCLCDDSGFCHFNADDVNASASSQAGTKFMVFMVIAFGCAFVFAILVILLLRHKRKWLWRKDGEYSSLPLGYETGIEKLALTRQDYADEDSDSEAELFSQD